MGGERETARGQVVDKSTRAAEGGGPYIQRRYPQDKWDSQGNT